jgi:hypothetical protein
MYLLPELAAGPAPRGPVGAPGPVEVGAGPAAMVPVGAGPLKIDIQRE